MKHYALVEFKLRATAVAPVSLSTVLKEIRDNLTTDFAIAGGIDCIEVSEAVQVTITCHELPSLTLPAWAKKDRA